MSVAIVFPGQGSQKVRMGYDFLEVSSEYQKVIEVLKNNNTEVIRALEGELDINQTLYAQLALFSNQVGILNTIREMYEIPKLSYAGFSLGEYTALWASGAYDFELGFDIISKRAKVMDAIESTYVTRVVIGKTMEELKQIISELNETLVHPIIISNYNMAKQQLINFDQSEAGEVEAGLKNHGVKRVIEIKVSGPFHTEIYQPAAEIFKAYLESLELNRPKGLYLNLTGEKYNGESLANNGYGQMINGVQWKTEIENMIVDGIDTFIEVGSTAVVSNMIKKINRKVSVITIECPEDLGKLEELWNKK